MLCFLVLSIRCLAPARMGPVRADLYLTRRADYVGCQVLPFSSITRPTDFFLSSSAAVADDAAIEIPRTHARLLLSSRRGEILRLSRVSYLGRAATTVRHTARLQRVVALASACTSFSQYWHSGKQILYVYVKAYLHSSGPEIDTVVVQDGLATIRTAVTLPSARPSAWKTHLALKREGVYSAIGCENFSSRCEFSSGGFLCFYADHARHNTPLSSYLLPDFHAFSFFSIMQGKLESRCTAQQ